MTVKLAEATKASEQLASEKQNLQTELEKLNKERVEFEAKVEAARDDQKREVKTLKRQVKEAERSTERNETEWRAKLEEMLVKVNMEREKMLEEHHAQCREYSSREKALEERLTVAQGSYEQLEREASEKREAHGSNAARISELELQLSQLQEQHEAKMADMEKKAEAKIAALKEQFQDKLRSTKSKVDSSVLEIQLELEQKYEKEKAEMASRHEELTQSHERKLRDAQDIHTRQLAEMKKTLKSMRAETQTAKDNLLTESEKSAKLEQQLVELQLGHQVEIEALKSQHGQELVEQAAQGQR